MTKIAICQPYFAPYLGYFQLLNAVDIFVSYDDVNFIKGGWINRQRILINGKDHLFTIPLKKPSQNKKINETYIDWDSKGIKKLFKTLHMGYAKSKYKNDVLDILQDIFKKKPDTISILALESIRSFCRYLDIDINLKISSDERYKKTGDRSFDLINICKQEKATHYINPIGGIKLYNKEEFKKESIELNFLKGTGSLSIIDVCMKYPVEEIKQQLGDFKLI